MVVFELLLVALVFVTVCGLIAVLVSAGTKNILIMKQIATILGVAWSVYFAALFIVAAATPQRIHAMHEDECFNDVCFAVANIGQNGARMTVTLQEVNRSRGTAEGAPGVRARIWDGKQYYAPETGADFGKVLKSGQTMETQLAFDIPADIKPMGLVLDRGLTPRYFVIGESPLFHKPALLRLN